MRGGGRCPRTDPPQISSWYIDGRECKISKKSAEEGVQNSDPHALAMGSEVRKTLVVSAAQNLRPCWGCPC